MKEALRCARHTIVEISVHVLEEMLLWQLRHHQMSERILHQRRHRLQDLVYVNNFFMAPGSSSELCHLLCGQIDATNIGGIHGNVEEGEDIRVFSEPATAAFKRVKHGEIASAFSIIGLQWLELNREALRRRWT